MILAPEECFVDDEEVDELLFSGLRMEVSHYHIGYLFGTLSELAYKLTEAYRIYRFLMVTGDEIMVVF